MFLNEVSATTLRLVKKNVEGNNKDDVGFMLCAQHLRRVITS